MSKFPQHSSRGVADFHRVALPDLNIPDPLWAGVILTWPFSGFAPLSQQTILDAGINTIPGSQIERA